MGAAHRRQRRRNPETLDAMTSDRISQYFVYRCYDAAGVCLYIGRSNDPVRRLRDHHGTVSQVWPRQVVQVDVAGPFTWPEAVRLERQAIEAAQPVHNIIFTAAAGWRRRPALPVVERSHRRRRRRAS